MNIAERKTERDYSMVFDETVKQTGEYCIKHNLKSLVLGLSVDWIQLFAQQLDMKYHKYMV